MKKLMVMAAVVALAAASQAASWDWSVSAAATAAYDSSSAVVGNTTAYLFFGYANTTDAAAAKTAVVEALYAGSAISGYTDSVMLNSSGTTDSARTVSIDGTASALGKRYGFVVITSTDSAGGDWAYISANKNGTGADTGATALSFALSSATTYAMEGTALNANTSGTGWHQFSAGSPVPEPTSGLLMLLGVAGLALRRRRA